MAHYILQAVKRRWCMNDSLHFKPTRPTLYPLCPTLRCDRTKSIHAMHPTTDILQGICGGIYFALAIQAEYKD